MSRQQERYRWYGMLYRCENPRSPAYPRYGGRGIKVCEAWHDFETYYADIMRLLGPCPDGKSIDRIDNDGHYEPGNVRWASCWQQVLNSSTCKPRDQIKRRYRPSMERSRLFRRAFLSPEEVAFLLGVTESDVLVLMRSGELRFTSMSGDWTGLVGKVWLEEYIGRKLQ